MLKKCSSALLLTDVTSFGETYKSLAEECEVNMRVESEWNSNYRITEDVVICGSKYIEDINVAYYPSIVLILKSNQIPFEYVSKGIERFIFNHNDDRELSLAFLKAEKNIVSSSNVDLKKILSDSNSMTYICGDYDFHFDTNKFSWKGRQIFLSEANKKYLAEWLLNGNKDNKKRMSLHNMRERLGKDFLKDINRFGELKEKKHE